MEQLTINIPEKKSALVKQLLRELGVTIQAETEAKGLTYKEKIARVSCWTDDDIKAIEDAQKSFGTLKPLQW